MFWLTIVEFRRAGLYGWDQDQRWTLARVAALVTWLFGVSYALRGASYLPHRLGFTPQVAANPPFGGVS